MEVTDVAIEIDNRLAVEPENHAQHAVRRRVLRAHVQHHLRAVEEGLLSCRYFYLMHFLNLSSIRVLRGWLHFVICNTRSHGTAQSPTRCLQCHHSPACQPASARSRWQRWLCSTRFAGRQFQSEQTPPPRLPPAYRTLLRCSERQSLL